MADKHGHVWSFLPFAINVILIFLLWRAQMRANVVSYMMCNLVHSPCLKIKKQVQSQLEKFCCQKMRCDKKSMNRERNVGNMVDLRGWPSLELQQWNVVRHVMTFHLKNIWTCHEKRSYHFWDKKFKWSLPSISQPVEENINGDSSVFNVFFNNKMWKNVHFKMLSLIMAFSFKRAKTTLYNIVPENANKKDWKFQVGSWRKISAYS